MPARRTPVSRKQTTVSPSAVVHPGVKLGLNVTVRENAILYPNVRVGDGSFIGPGCILGEPLADYYKGGKYENPPTRIGKNVLLRAYTIIYAGCELGEGFQTGNAAVLREYSIFGKHCSFGVNSQSDGKVRVGDYCRFHNNVFLSQDTKIGSYTWMFPFSATLDARHPPCRGCARGPEIGRRVIIGARALILPRVKIAADAVVGAASVVTRDVRKGMLVAGAPATVRKKASEAACDANPECFPYPWDIGLVHGRRNPLIERD